MSDLGQSGESRLDRRVRESEERDEAREQKRREDRARRGQPQRFTLRGMVYHPSPDRPGDGSWTLPEIDPPPERDEVIEVVSITDALRCLTIGSGLELAEKLGIDNDSPLWGDVDA